MDWVARMLLAIPFCWKFPQSVDPMFPEFSLPLPYFPTAAMPTAFFSSKFSIKFAFISFRMLSIAEKCFEPAKIVNNKRRTTLLLFSLFFTSFTSGLSLTCSCEYLSELETNMFGNGFEFLCSFLLCTRCAVSWMLHGLWSTTEEHLRAQARKRVGGFKCTKNKMWFEMESSKCMWLEWNSSFVVMIWPHPFTWLDHTHTTNCWRLSRISLYLFMVLCNFSLFICSFPI